MCVCVFEITCDYILSETIVMISLYIAMIVTQDVKVFNLEMRQKTGFSWFVSHVNLEHNLYIYTWIADFQRLKQSQIRLLRPGEFEL